MIPFAFNAREKYGHKGTRSQMPLFKKTAAQNSRIGAGKSEEWPPFFPFDVFCYGNNDHALKENGRLDIFGTVGACVSGMEARPKVMMTPSFLQIKILSTPAQGTIKAAIRSQICNSMSQQTCARGQ